MIGPLALLAALALTPEVLQDEPQDISWGESLEAARLEAAGGDRPMLVVFR